MGQYFRFINRDRQVESEVGLPFNFGMPQGKGLERLSTEELKKHSILLFKPMTGSLPTILLQKAIMVRPSAILTPANKGSVAGSHMCNHNWQSRCQYCQFPSLETALHN